VSARAASRVLGLVGGTAFVLTAMAGTASAEEPCAVTEVCVPAAPARVKTCLVDIGYCETHAGCVVNVGYCENDGACTINVGHCSAGESGSVAVDTDIPPAG